MNKIITGLFIWLLGNSVYGQIPLVISDVNIINPKTGEIQNQMTILIEEGKIKSMGPKSSISLPSNAQLIVANDKWVVPSWVDGHVHFFQSGGLYTRPDVIDLRKFTPYAQEQKWISDHINEFFDLYLKAGIGNVFDFGGPMSNYDIREKSKDKNIAPNLFVTGPLISTYQPEEFATIEDPPILLARTPEEARAMVKKQIPLNPNFIKIWYIVRQGETPAQHLPIIKAIMEESHLNKIPVAVHATELETARLAVQSGADILVHSIRDKKVDKSFLQLLKNNRVTYIPTLTVGRNYDEVLSQNIKLTKTDFELSHPHPLGTLQDLKHLPKEDLPAWVRRLMSNPLPSDSDEKEIMNYNLKKVIAAGVNVVTGTDAGNIGTLHASSYYEEIQAMSDAGLSLLEILQACTVNAANMINSDEKWGSVEPGHKASFLLLNANPLKNIHNFSGIHLMVHNGKLIDPETIYNPDPETIIQQAINAYNRRDIEAYVSSYHPQLEVLDWNGKIEYAGREPLKRRYLEIFDNVPDLYCHVTNKMVLGNTVITQERITGFANDREVVQIAIYKILNGMIKEVKFIQQ